MTDESNKEEEEEEEIVKLDDKERQPCEIWTRVMGYFRPVSEFNVGKKSEANERKYFSVKKTVRKLLCRD